MVINMLFTICVILFWFGAFLVFMGANIDEAGMAGVGLLMLLGFGLVVVPSWINDGNVSAKQVETRRDKTLAACIAKSPTCIDLITKEPDEDKRAEYLKIYRGAKK